MKKLVALLAAAGLMAAATTAFAGTIVNSKHDLTSTGPVAVGTAGSSTQLCVYCHAPHNANMSLPLWNRNNPTTVFTLYSGVGMQNVSFKTGFTTDSTSLFCMSCHDGQTRMNDVYNAGALDGTGTVGNVHTAANGVFRNGTITGPANLTTNLSKTHPINFPVSETALSQSDLNVGSGASMGPGVAPGITWIGRTYPLFKSTNANASRTTPNRSLECGSCHAVHDSGYKPFLRDTMDRSTLCLGCHNK